MLTRSVVWVLKARQTSKQTNKQTKKKKKTKKKFYFCGWKIRFWPMSTGVKEVEWHWDDQAIIPDSSILMSSSFVCLYCAKSKQEKQVILALGAWVCHQTGHYFIYRGEIRWKLRLLHWPGVDVRSTTTRGTVSTVWHVDAVRPPRIWSQVVTTRGCKASCGSYSSR